MSQDLKAGDTCLIIRCGMFPEYVGRSVELIACLRPGDVNRPPDAPAVGFRNTVGPHNAWVIHSHHDYLLKTDQGVTTHSNYAAFAEYCLLKISGEPDKSKILAGRVLDKSYRFMPVRGA